MTKKLTRSLTDRKLCGVCSGIAKYFDIDPTIVRLMFVLATFFACGGLLAYLISALVMPNESNVE